MLGLARLRNKFLYIVFWGYHRSLLSIAIFICSSKREVSQSLMFIKDFVFVTQNGQGPGGGSY